MKLGNYIDHTNLNPTATPGDIKRLCAEAKANSLYAVCVNGSYVALAQEELKGTEVHLVAVVGFPLGAMSTAAKMDEARQNIKAGADEIDMVLNLGWLKAEWYDKVENDIAAVKMVVGNRPLKVILETGYLTDAEKRKACEIVEKAHADFVKTATGFGPGGATLADIRLMKEAVGDRLQIKASGGIKTYDQAMAFIKAGANRIGASSGVALANHK